MRARKWTLRVKESRCGERVAHHAVPRLAHVARSAKEVEGCPSACGCGAGAGGVVAIVAHAPVAVLNQESFACCIHQLRVQRTVEHDTAAVILRAVEAQRKQLSNVALVVNALLLVLGTAAVILVCGGGGGGGGGGKQRATSNE